MMLLVAVLYFSAHLFKGAMALPASLPVGPGTISNNILTPGMLAGPAIETYPTVATPFINNIQVTPTISELVPSLQYGDLTMGGELPIGGTIKVCGCFPVYGMIAVDGAVPSAGTALVDDMFGRQSFEVRSGIPFY